MNRRRYALLLAALIALALAGCKSGATASTTVTPRPTAILPPVSVPTASPPTVVAGQRAANLPTPSLSIPGTHTSVQGATVTADIGTLVVDGKIGDITVVGSDRSGIEVVDQAAYSSTPPVIARAVSGSTLTVSYTCAVQIACGVAFVIAVPRSTAVQAATDTGAIRLTGLAGAVTAKADAGFIDASGLTAQHASFTTDVGGIDVTFTSPPRNVTARTRVSAITIRVPATVAYHVIVHTIVGHVTISVPQGSGSARTITASTDVGTVDVTPG